MSIYQSNPTKIGGQKLAFHIIDRSLRRIVCQKSFNIAKFTMLGLAVGNDIKKNPVINLYIQYTLHVTIPYSWHYSWRSYCMTIFKLNVAFFFVDFQNSSLNYIAISLSRRVFVFKLLEQIMNVEQINGTYAVVYLRFSRSECHEHAIILG